MDLAEYRSFVTARVPRPTPKNIDAYADFVSADHSWYKHLPLVGPGEPFMLYLAPHAGQVFLDSGTTYPGWRDFIVDRDNAGRFVRRFTVDLRPGDDPLDESWQMTLHRIRQTTDQRRVTYGHWLYWNHGRPNESRETHVARAMEGLTFHDDGGFALPLPREVIEAGLVYLNGIVSGILGGTAEYEYVALRAEHDLPSHDEIREIQLEALRAAMRRVASLLWD